MNRFLMTCALAALAGFGTTLPVVAHDAPAHAAGTSAAGGAAPSVTIGEIRIDGAFTRATLPNAPVGGGYFTITNTGTRADRLVSVATAAAGTAQIHEMRLVDDVMKMSPLPDGLEIPAGGSVALAPGGYHLMFMGLTGPFVEGTDVPVTLTFETAGSVEIALHVGASNADAPPCEQMEH